MASFTDLIAQSIHLRREEFLAGLAREPDGEIERLLATGIEAHWHPFESERLMNGHPGTSSAVAVDGSRAIRALSNGADWIIAQALLIGPDGLRSSSVDTRLLRGEIERPAVDRFASLLMRSLELELALNFVQSGMSRVLILDGSLYADLPYLLYNLAIGGYEDLPLQVLEQYLNLFDLCQKRDVLLLGISKSARSAVLGRALLERFPSFVTPISQQRMQTSSNLADADVQEDMEFPPIDIQGVSSRQREVRPGMNGLPTDGELLHRWTKGRGLTDPVLLGSASFGRASTKMDAKLNSLGRQPLDELQTFSSQHEIQRRLLNAPAIGTFYMRLAPGEDALRVDALARTFGRDDLRLLGFDQIVVSHSTALPLVQHLLGEYGGLSVYNAALYVVDREVRLRAETVDHVYLPVLRSQLGLPVQYDRSTRRFIR